MFREILRSSEESIRLIGVVDTDEFERGAEIGVGIVFVFVASSFTSLINSVIRCSLLFNAIVRVLTLIERECVSGSERFDCLTCCSVFLHSRTFDSNRASRSAVDSSD